jgi:hypothetical protein
MLSISLAVRDFASVTCTVKLLLPIVVGVPVIAPVLLFKLKPGGKLPEVMLHVKGGVPVPRTTPRVALYGAPTTPGGKLDTDITGASGTTGLERPPHAVRNTQRISANPSAANTLHDLIGSPCEPHGIACSGQLNHISRLAFYASQSGKTGRSSVRDLLACTGLRPTRLQPHRTRRFNDKIVAHGNSAS